MIRVAVVTENAADDLEININALIRSIVEEFGPGVNIRTVKLATAVDENHIYYTAMVIYDAPG